MVVQLMIPKQLLSEDIVMTAQSCYNKNRLILEQIRLMDIQAFMSLCELLKASDSQNHIGEMMLTGKWLCTTEHS